MNCLNCKDSTSHSSCSKRSVFAVHCSWSSSQSRHSMRLCATSSFKRSFRSVASLCLKDEFRRPRNRITADQQMTKCFKLRQQCYKERSLRRVVAENVLRVTNAARKLLEQVQDPSSRCHGSDTPLCGRQKKLCTVICSIGESWSRQVRFNFNTAN